jgi:hypothetical protein
VAQVLLSVSIGELSKPRGDRPVTQSTERIRIEQHSFVGTAWFGGWLFSIGFLHLSFWKGVLAVVLWPYFLGVTVQMWVH